MKFTTGAVLLGLGSRAAAVGYVIGDWTSTVATYTRPTGVDKVWVTATPTQWWSNGPWSTVTIPHPTPFVVGPGGAFGPGGLVQQGDCTAWSSYYSSYSSKYPGRPALPTGSDCSSWSSYYSAHSTLYPGYGPGGAFGPGGLVQQGDCTAWASYYSSYSSKYPGRPALPTGSDCSSWSSYYSAHSTLYPGYGPGGDWGPGGVAGPNGPYGGKPGGIIVDTSPYTWSGICGYLACVTSTTNAAGATATKGAAGSISTGIASGVTVAGGITTGGLVVAQNTAAALGASTTGTAALAVATGGAERRTGAFSAGGMVLVAIASLAVVLL